MGSARCIHQCRLVGVLITLIAVSLAGCSFLEPDDGHDRSGSLPPLEVPPTLDSPGWNQALDIPAGNNGKPVSARETERSEAKQAEAKQANILPPTPDMRIRRQGNVRWLEVDTDPVSLWPALKTFWKQAGLQLAEDKPALGIMETEWVKHRIDLATEVQQASLGNSNAGKYYIQTRDKYRIRLEREPNARTNVYLTHRSAEITGTDEDQNPVWDYRPGDPEVEAEKLVALMEYLGVSRASAEARLKGTTDVQPTIRLEQLDGVPVLLIGDTFSRVWRHTGIALDRAGLAVGEQDRNLGTYHVKVSRPVDSGDSTGAAADGASNLKLGSAAALPPDDPNKKGQASHGVADQAAAESAAAAADGPLDHAQGKAAQRARYQIHLLAQSNQTLITAHKDGARIDQATAKRLLKRLVAAYNSDSSGTVSSR